MPINGRLLHPALGNLLVYHTAPGEPTARSTTLFPHTAHSVSYASYNQESKYTLVLYGEEECRPGLSFQCCKGVFCS